MTSMAIPDVVAGIEDHLDEADRVLVLGPAEDALAAARAVGTAGRVIGVGPTGPDLAAAEDERRRAGWFGLEFRQETAGALPADDGSVDAVVLAPPVALSRARGALLSARSPGCCVPVGESWSWRGACRGRADCAHAAQDLVASASPRPSTALRLW